MPAPVAPLIGLLLGFAFAWAAADELSHRTEGALATRSLLVVTLFGLAVFAPICGYFLAFSPDWAFAYLLDHEGRTSAIEIGLALVDAASPTVGFLVAARSAATRSLVGLLRWAAVPGSLVVLFLVTAARRLAVVATYAQYHGNFGTRPLAGSALGYALLWMLALLVFATVWTLRSVRRFGDEARSD